ncbi:MAG: FAD-dependent oxidoreductase [Candidatus Binatia bacterium]
MAQSESSPGSVRYPHLFSPLQLGRLTLPNRFALTATAEVFSHGDGFTNKRSIRYLCERAEAGVGLLITGNRLVDFHSQAPCRGYTFGHLREGLARDRELAQAVHERGAAIIAQFNHFGMHANSFGADDYRVLMAPSPLKSPVWNETPKAMEPEDLARLRDHFVLCAALVQEAGFDGAELHMTNSYLLHQFLSPVYNQRTDAYGGSFENRLRFPLQVLAAVRARVGRDFVVGVRLTVDENLPGGMGPDDWANVARHIAATGHADYLGVSAGTYHSFGAQVGIEDLPDGYLLAATATLKHAVSTLPVMASGGLQDPQLAERVLAAGEADLIGLSRPLLADAHYVQKVQAGHERDVQRCIRCNQGCIARLFKGAPVACTINPAFGREELFGRGTLQQTSKPGHWLVVGGGPAGMRAALVLAQRGHRVTLHEKADRLGGQVQLLVKQPGRRSFRYLIEDLTVQLEKSGVELRLNSEMNTQAVMAARPDGVVLATGSQPLRTGVSPAAPFVTKLPGVEQRNVLTVWDILEAPQRVGTSVLLLDDDGTRYSAGTAEFLLDHGKKVHLVTRMPSLFAPLGGMLEQPTMYQRLFSKGLQFSLNSWVKRFQGDCATVYNLYSGQETELSGIDTFVLATGHKANDELYFALKGKIPTLFRIGDCLAPRLLDHAIYEAELAGRELLNSEARYIRPGQLEH